MSVYREPVPTNQEGRAGMPTPELLGYSEHDPQDEARTRKKHRRTLGAAVVGTVAAITTVAMLSSGKESPVEAYRPSISTTAEALPSSTTSVTETSPTTTTLERPAGWRETRVMIVHDLDELAISQDRMPVAEDIPMFIARTLNSLANYDVINGGAANPPATIQELKEFAKKANISLNDGMWKLIEKDREPNEKYSYSEKIGSSYTVDPASVKGLGAGPTHEGITGERYPNMSLGLQKGVLNTYTSTDTQMVRPFPGTQGGEGIIHTDVAWNSQTGAIRMIIELQDFEFTK